MTATAPQPDETAAAGLLGTLTGAWVARAVSAAARLGLPDQLASGPATAAELADRLGADPDGLRRLLRVLAGAGILTHGAGGFALTEQGRLLCSGVPGSLRPLAILYGEDYFTGAWTRLDEALRQDANPFRLVFGQSIYEYLSARPDKTRGFDAGMAAGVALATGLPEVYDLSGADLIVDVGGGDGSLLASVLRANPAGRGILFDRPTVADAARASLAGRGLADRCETVGGDFFTGIPGGGDIYLMSRVLHNWNDQECRQILARCRDAMKPSARLLIIERIVPDEGPVPLLTAAFDLHMLVMTNGRERTGSDYHEMLTAVGLRPGRTVPLPTGLAALEAFSG